MNNLMSEMSEYFSDPEADTFAVSREEWQTLISVEDLNRQKRKIAALVEKYDTVNYITDDIYRKLLNELRQLSKG